MGLPARKEKDFREALLTGTAAHNAGEKEESCDDLSNDRGMVLGSHGRGTRNDAERVFLDGQVIVMSSDKFAAFQLRGSASMKGEVFLGGILDGNCGTQGVRESRDGEGEEARAGTSL